MKKAPCRHSRWEAVSNVPWACKERGGGGREFRAYTYTAASVCGKEGGRECMKKGVAFNNLGTFS